MHFDIIKNKFPYVDLWICRDCLFHFSFVDIYLALKNFICSDIPYMLTTTHKNSNNFKNFDIQTGDFRLIDLFSEPFNFSKDVFYKMDDWIDPHPERHMCLWSRDQIVDVVNSMQISSTK